MTLTTDKEGHYIIHQGEFKQEDITLVNIHPNSIEVTKYIQKILEDFKEGFDRNIVIIHIFKTDCQQCMDFPNKKIMKVLHN